MAKILETTHQKLLRCLALLREMEAHEKEHEKFDALLESFVDCSRSVTFVLQKEIKDKHLKLKEWYKEKQNEMKSPDNSLLTFFNEVRRIVTHQQPLGMVSPTNVKEIMIRQVPQGWGFINTLRGEPMWVKDSGTEFEQRIHASEFDSQITTKHFIVNPKPPSPIKLSGVDYSGYDALTICKLYFAYLSSLVQEGEWKAGSS
jgi:hypothetical protein